MNNIKPGQLAFSAVRHYDPVTRIVELVCGHRHANVTPRQVSEKILACTKCQIPERQKRARARKPFWLAA